MKALREKDIPDASMYPGKVKRLALAMIKRGCSREDAFAFITSAKGISDRDKPAVAAWFAQNLPKLPGELGGKALHEDCACCLGGKRYEEAKRIFAEEPNLSSRIRRLLKTPLIVGYSGEVLDAQRFAVAFFPEMEYYRCPCLQFEKGKQPIAMSKEYCYCCCGHLKHHISKALGCHVEVELVTSSLTTFGKEGCRFLVHVKEEGK